MTTTPSAEMMKPEPSEVIAACPWGGGVRPGRGDIHNRGRKPLDQIGVAFRWMAHLRGRGRGGEGDQSEGGDE
ncbi:MAG TPA: hypothetical protein PLK37_07950 [Terricaulis sp.]|nr:hypothetical protein [Terricaulis sp.]